MKNSILIIALLLLPLLASASPGDKDSKVKNLFVFRTDKKLVGAKIEVFGVAGDLLTTQMLHKRKMIIDFGAVEWGTYTIRVTKEGQVKEFKYNKKN